MIRKITADLVCPVSQAPIPQGVILIDDVTHKIVGLDTRVNHDAATLEIHSGVLVPGFVNTHCHLELSHMLDRVPTGTGLLPFIEHVVKYRNVAPEAIQQAIQTADKAMYDNGIVAVGDISNVVDSFATKQQSKLRYYTFVEFFDFMQESNTDATFAQYKAVFDQLQLPAKHRKSCVPHAPYSVSPKLYQLLNRSNSEFSTISIHNQETPPENHLFLDGNSDFKPFFGQFGVSLDHVQPIGKTSIHSALQHLDPQHRTLFVHNTLTTKEDIETAQQWSQQVYWATCPNANLYIENRLPNYKYFIDTNAKVTIGTDSLTSNWQLSVLEEMKTIAKYQSFIDFHTLLKWATLNGAEALGFEADFGSFEVGKTPAINLLNLDNSLKLSNLTTVQRLF